MHAGSQTSEDSSEQGEAASEEVIQKGTAFSQKSFTPVGLAQMVRNVLDLGGPAVAGLRPRPGSRLSRVRAKQV